MRAHTPAGRTRIDRGQPEYHKGAWVWDQQTTQVMELRNRFDTAPISKLEPIVPATVAPTPTRNAGSSDNRSARTSFSNKKRRNHSSTANTKRRNRSFSNGLVSSQTRRWPKPTDRSLPPRVADPQQDGPKNTREHQGNGEDEQGSNHTRLWTDDGGEDEQIKPDTVST